MIAISLFNHKCPYRKKCEAYLKDHPICKGYDDQIRCGIYRQFANKEITEWKKEW